MTLQKLIEKLEAANKGSRELDCLIEVAGRFTGRIVGDARIDVLLRESPFSGAREGETVADSYAIPNYTTSLDAALTLLVPERRLMLSIKCGWKPGPWLVNIEREDGGAVKWIAGAVADTGPLALCIAALKARLQADTNTRSDR